MISEALLLNTTLSNLNLSGNKFGKEAKCALKEAWGTGTAAVISPIGKIVDHGKEICLPSGMDDFGPVLKKVYDTLTGIQMGEIEAPEGWIYEIC